MRATAKLLYFTGLASVAAALGLMILLFAQRHLDREPLLQLPIETDAVFETGPVSLDASKMRLAVDLDFRSHAIGEQYGDRGELDLFRLPVHYRIVDAAGRVLLSQSKMADAVGSRLVRPEFRQGSRGVWHTRRIVSDPFQSVAGQPLRMEVALLPDLTYGAKLEAARLLVFKQPTPILTRLHRALLLGLAGLGLLLLGLLTEVLPFALSANRRPARSRPTVAPAPMPVAGAYGGKVIGSIGPKPRPLPDWEAPLHGRALS